MHACTCMRLHVSVHACTLILFCISQLLPLPNTSPPHFLRCLAALPVFLETPLLLFLSIHTTPFVSSNIFFSRSQHHLERSSLSIFSGCSIAHKKWRCCRSSLRILRNFHENKRLREKERQRQEGREGQKRKVIGKERERQRYIYIIYIYRDRGTQKRDTGSKRDRK